MRIRNRWKVEHRVRTAQEFLDILSPANGLLAGHYEPNDFIYRGHGSHEYKLVPNAFRGRRFPYPDRRPVRRRTNENQILTEIEHLWEFFLLADARGLRLPEDSQSLRKSAHFQAHPYDELIVREVGWDLVENVYLFYKFTLPTRQAPELLRLLVTMGFDASTLFPGYDGVARALREQQFLPRPGQWYDSRSSRLARTKYANVWHRWRGK